MQRDLPQPARKHLRGLPVLLALMQTDIPPSQPKEDTKQVNDLMTPNTVTLIPDQTLKDAAEILQRIEIGFGPLDGTTV